MSCLLPFGCDNAPPATTSNPATAPEPPSATQVPARAKLPPLKGNAQALTVYGKALYPLTLDAEVRRQRQVDLSSALELHRTQPDDLDAHIWVGRRQAYLGEYRRAIATFSEAIEKHPNRPEPLRHRGHRYVTLRLFEAAIADLEHAARLCLDVPNDLEADGLPNAAGIPVSSLHFNVWYHLGLAHYLRQDMEKASAAFRYCLELAMQKNADQVVAAVYWFYHALNRSGQSDAAQKALELITGDLELHENHTYMALLLLYKGDRTLEELQPKRALGVIENATLAYGLARWYLMQEREDEALTRLRQLAASGPWPAFAAIAAEFDLFALEAQAKRAQQKSKQEGGK